MSTTVSHLHVAVVEEEVTLTVYELSRASFAPVEQIEHWVIEGILEPAGEGREEWRFTGVSLRRARTAYRLCRDLEVNTAGVALALDLLDEIAGLRAKLERLQHRDSE